MSSKYTVSLAVDGRIAVDVDAESPQEAYERAKEAFSQADLRLMEVVKATPVNAYDRNAHTLTDY